MFSLVFYCKSSTSGFRGLFLNDESSFGLELCIHIQSQLPITGKPSILSFIGNSSLLFYFQTNALECWNLKVKQMAENRKWENELRLNRKKIPVFAPRIIEGMNNEPIQSISVNRDQTVYGSLQI